MDTWATSRFLASCALAIVQIVAPVSPDDWQTAKVIAGIIAGLVAVLVGSIVIVAPYLIAPK